MEPRKKIIWPTHRVDALQECITQDVKGQVTTGLDTAVNISGLGLRKCQSVLVDGELRVANRKGDRRQLVWACIAREDVALDAAVVRSAGDGAVDGLEGLVVDKSEGGARVGNGRVSRAVDGLPVHGGGGGAELPETLAFINRGVRDLLTCRLDGVLIEIAECVPGLIVGLFGRSQVDRKELLGLGNLILSDQVLHGGLDRVGLHGVDVAKCQSEQTITWTRDERGRQVLCKLDGLVPDDQAPQVQNIRPHVARRGGTISIGDLPGLA